MKIQELYEDPSESSLYKDLKQAGVEVDRHESDLYFPMNKQTMEILNRYPLQKKNATSFINQDTKARWIDVPFAFDPFWDKVKPGKEVKEGEGLMKKYSDTVMAKPQPEQRQRVSLLKDHTVVKCDNGPRYEFQGMLSAEDIKKKLVNCSGVFSARKVGKDGGVIDQISGTF